MCSALCIPLFNPVFNPAFPCLNRAESDNLAQVWFECENTRLRVRCGTDGEPEELTSRKPHATNAKHLAESPVFGPKGWEPGNIKLHLNKGKLQKRREKGVYEQALKKLEKEQDTLHKAISEELREQLLEKIADTGFKGIADVSASFVEEAHLSRKGKLNLACANPEIIFECQQKEEDKEEDGGKKEGEWGDWTDLETSARFELTWVSGGGPWV